MMRPKRRERRQKAASGDWMKEHRCEILPLIRVRHREKLAVEAAKKLAEAVKKPVPVTTVKAPSAPVAMACFTALFSGAVNDDFGDEHGDPGDLESGGNGGMFVPAQAVFTSNDGE